MTDRYGRHLTGWTTLGSDREPQPTPFAAWYEVWRAHQVACRADEECERAKLRREIGWMSTVIAAWSLLMGGAAAFAIWIVL